MISSFYCFLLGNIFKSTILEKKIIAVAGRDSRILLSCPFSLRTPVTWLKDGTPLQLSTKYISSRGNLIVTKVDETDEGRYACQCRVLDGSIRQVVFHVVVNSKFDHFSYCLRELWVVNLIQRVHM